VIANALSAGFHLITQRARPPPVGSRDLGLDIGISGPLHALRMPFQVCGCVLPGTTPYNTRSVIVHSDILRIRSVSYLTLAAWRC
jgi:hypothetical protein